VGGVNRSLDYTVLRRAKQSLEVFTFMLIWGPGLEKVARGRSQLCIKLAAGCCWMAPRLCAQNSEATEPYPGKPLRASINCPMLQARGIPWQTVNVR
jgi:hypothetical protein